MEQCFESTFKFAVVTLSNNMAATQTEHLPLSMQITCVHMTHFCSDAKSMKKTLTLERWLINMHSGMAAIMWTCGLKCFPGGRTILLSASRAKPF